MTIEEDVALQIKAARTKLGYSQRRLAELCGMSYPQLARIETAKNSVSIGILERICKPLGLKIKLDRAE